MLFRRQGGIRSPHAAEYRDGQREHPSPGLKAVLEQLGGSGGQVLDLGPADEGTLSFLGGLGYEVQVADLRGAGACDFSTFQEEGYQAVLAWDLLARMPQEERPRLASRLSSLLRPGGVLFQVLPADGPTAGWHYRFRILATGRVEYRPGGGVLTGPVPTNREVLRLFSSLQCSGARILRHGAREFILRRPALA